MVLTNQDIYQYAFALSSIFDDTLIYIPVKINFYIQKNLHIITTAGEEIEQARLAIAQHYGALDQNANKYIVPLDKIQEANKEINDLFAIEQELDIKMIKLEDLGNIELTPKQMQALMFMIEE